MDFTRRPTVICRRCGKEFVQDGFAVFCSADCTAEANASRGERQANLVAASSPGPAGSLTAMSEEDFQQDVIDLAKLRKWRYYHCRNSRKSTAGFPDLVLVSAARGRIVYMELKTESGEPSAEQLNWIDDLKACGQEAYIFRPSDFPKIEELLK